MNARVGEDAPDNLHHVRLRRREKGQGRPFPRLKIARGYRKSRSARLLFNCCPKSVRR